MNEPSEEFQAVDNAGARPVEVRLPVHGVDVTLTYGWQVIPASQLLQRRERSAGLCQRGATGAEQQHLRGVFLQPHPRHRWGWRPWYTTTGSAPGELNQVREPVPGESER